MERSEKSGLFFIFKESEELYLKKLITLLTFALILIWHPVPSYGGNAIIVEETWEQVLEEQKEPCLNSYIGVFKNKEGYKETYYNLNMPHIVERMRRKGFTEDDYPYYIREDGVKMLGDFVMVAADLGIHKRGSVVYTSLGQGIVCDTGSAIKGKRLDIAADW